MQTSATSQQHNNLSLISDPAFSKNLLKSSISVNAISFYSILTSVYLSFGSNLGHFNYSSHTIDEQRNGYLLYNLAIVFFFAFSMSNFCSSNVGITTIN